MNKPFNLWLRDEIAKRGQTQREFAKRAQIHKSTLTKYIAGALHPYDEIESRIIHTLELITKEQKKRNHEQTI